MHLTPSLESHAIVVWLAVTGATFGLIASGEAQVPQTNLAAIVRHAPNLNGNGRIEGSAQQLLGEAVTLNGGFTITGDLLVPGTPTVHVNGHPDLGGTVVGSGNASPSGYPVTLNGNCSLRTLRTRIDPVALPTVGVPPSPTGTRNVTIKTPDQPVGDPATLRNLTLNGYVGQVVVPPGTYGNFIAHGGSGFTLGVGGATTPSIYNLQNLALNGQSRLDLVGPVILAVASGFTANGTLGATNQPSWLQLQIASGGFTLNGGCTVNGSVTAPAGTVIINGNSRLIGRVQCDRLTVNGGGLIRAGGAITQPPVAMAQDLVVAEDEYLEVTLTGSDPEGAMLSFTMLSQPVHGTLSGVAPNLVYSPADNFHGEDSFTFKVNDGQADSAAAIVSITVTAVNDPPTAQPLDLGTSEDTPINFTMLGADIESDSLTFEIASPPSHGTVVLTSPSSSLASYIPTTNYTGADRFTYRVGDGQAWSAPAAVSLSIQSVDDAPVANAQTVNGDEDSPMAITLTGGDIEGETLVFTVLTQPTNGTLSGIAPNLVYTPNTNFNGTDSFTFRVSDSMLDSEPATVSLLIRPVNDAPVALTQTLVTSEDTATNLVLTATDVEEDTLSYSLVRTVANGTLTGAAPELVFSPAADFHGTNTFEFVASDGQTTSAPVVVTLIVTPVNDAPVADSGSYTGAEDTPVAISLNGSDVEGDPLIYAVLAPPTHGTLSGAGREWVYWPATNFCGQDGFTFRVSDGPLDSSVAVVSLTVTSVNDAPIVFAGADQTVTSLEVSLAGSVADDSLSGDPLFVSWSQASGPGTVIVTPPNQPVATAMFSAPGLYVLRLSASDSVAFSSDDVQIEVISPVGGEPPTVNAGPDQVVGLTRTAELMGSVISGGHSEVAINWSQVSGPGVVGFADCHVLATEASFSASGAYLLRLSASNEWGVANDDVAITLYLSNQPPAVQAGADQTITVPSGLLAPFPINLPEAPELKDSQGVEYWLAFPANLESYPEALELLITCATNATGTVTAPGAGFATNFSVSAGIVASVLLPMNLEIQTYDTNELKGVHLVADTEVTVYAVNRHRGSTGAYLALPTDALGTNYLILAYRNGLLSAGSKFALVATEDGTHVTITPTVASLARLATGIRTSGVPYTITLNRGETYQYMGTYNASANTDVSGSRVSADKPIGVWGGHKCATIPQNMPCDMIIEQLPPVETWGRSFVTLPLATRKSGDTVRILASATNTQVRFNGNVVTNLNAGEFHERIVSGPAHFTADQPILVAQYGNANSFDGVEFSDSSMAVVVPTDQFLSAYTLLIPAGRYATNYLNLTAPASAVGEILLDSVPLSATNFIAIGTSGFLGAQIKVAPGTHTLTSPVPFGVETYGYALADAYSYPGGMALAPLSRVAHLDFLAAAVTNYLDGLQCVQAAVSDQNNQPVAGVPVQFEVAGVHPLNGSGVTTPDGLATFCYRGESSGEDTLTASAVGLSNAVTVVWLPQSPSPVVTAQLHGAVQDDGLPVGGGMSMEWSQVSGSASASFSTSTSAVAIVSFPQSGAYQFRLTASDSDLAASDDVTVTVSFNQRPSVDAGPDFVTLATNFVLLNGTAQDDGLPSGRALDVFWKKVHGPGEVNFDDATSPVTTAWFAQPGIYVLRLTAFDAEFSARDEITVDAQTGGFPNQAPVVQAPADQTLALPQASLILAGTATDDGFPTNSLLTATWSQVRGPGTVIFGEATQLVTTATFPVTGYYLLRLTATDGQLSAQDEVAITVNPANAPPVVNAGPDQTIGLFNKAVLNSAVSDDGWPVGSLNLTWSQVSGPVEASFSTLNGIYRARFTAPGEYVLRLTAHDLELSASDDVTVTVLDAPNPPAVTIQSPLDAASITTPTVVTGTVSSDILQSWSLQYRLKPTDSDSLAPTEGDGQGEEATWTTLATGSISVTSAPLGTFDPTLLLNGIYELQLAATDLLGRSSTTEPATLIVDRNMKVGHFTVSFNDLTVPVAGIPITITRTYDSRDKKVGDFGVGWTFGLKNIRLQKNRRLGLNWEQSTTGGAFASYCLEPRRARVVTLTFPDGRTCKFQAAASPQCQFGVPISGPAIIYQPLANTRGSLLSLTADLDQVLVAGSVPGLVDLLEYDGNLYNPSLYQYTSDEGDVYVIDEHEGLQRTTDRNGSTLTISTNGIFYSASPGGPILKSVLFHRDARGCITNIMDPAGSSLLYHYDTNGNLAAFIDRENHTNRFAYSLPALPHHLTDLIDARGIQAVRNLYDDNGRLVAQVDANNQTNLFTHDLQGRREITTDRLGHSTIHWYDDNGNVVQTLDPLGHLTRFAYDANDNLFEQVDALGRTNRFAYDSQDNRIAATDPLGHTTRLTYDPHRLPTSVTDARGHTVTNRYDANGNLVWMRDPLGSVTTFGYQNGNLTAVTNAHGNVMRFGYNLAGQLTNRIDAHGHAIDYTRDATGNVLAQTTTRTTGSGVETLVTSFQHDRQGRLTNVISADGSSSATIFNAIGKSAVTIDPLGRKTRFEYDEQGRLGRTLFPDGTSEGNTYDLEGRLVARTNRLGHVTQFAFDPLGRLVRTEFADGATTTNYYDGAGQLVAATDARDFTTFYGYDDASRNIAVTNALLQVTRSEYDEVGNLVAAFDPLDRPTRFHYDALNRRTQTIFADATTASTLFDALGRRIAETDANTNTTGFAYDALGRLAAVTNALGHVTRYTYDELGELLAQTDANHHTTAFAYDAVGRRIGRTLPGGQFESYAYNLAGLMTSKLDFNGRLTQYRYDAMNRLTEKQGDPALGQGFALFAYDALGRRTNMVDASGSTGYRYDVRNRLVEKVKTWAVAGLSVALAYGYDASGNLNSLQSSSLNGTALAYEYDALNRLSAVNDLHLGRTAYTYDDAGNLQDTALPNGLTSTYRYDDLNRLTNLSTLSPQRLTVARYDYTLSPAGHRLTATEALNLNGQPSTLTRLYTYDATYRLLGETLTSSGSVGAPPAPASASLAYAYDDVGNRLTRTASGFATGALDNQSFTYDPNDRLNTDTYDANGNTLFGAGFSQTQGDHYDFENHLIERRSSIAGVSRTVNLAYDGDGNRVSKTVNGVITYYLVDDLNPTGYAQVLEELWTTDNGPLTAIRVYTHGHALLSQDQLLDTGTNWVWSASFYGTDGHGSTRYLTDAAGTVTDTYDYDAFGNLIAQTGLTPNLYLYSGEQFDPDLGLYYLRARYHNPATGRFWTSDGFEGFLGDPASLHRYTYCANNPVNATDPSGQYTLAEVQTATAIASTINSMAANAGMQTMLRGQAELANIGLNSAGVYEAIEVMAWYQLVSDLYAGFSIGRLGAAVLPEVGRATWSTVLSAYNRLRNITPKQWGGLKLWAPKSIARAAGRAEEVVMGLNGLSPNSAKNSPRAFWAGGDAAQAAAENYAKANGGTTLEMLNPALKPTSDEMLAQGRDWFSVVRPNVWEPASKQFAEEASGIVDVFQNAEGVSLRSVWSQVEYPALLRNPNVTGIRYHVVMPGGAAVSLK